jgi:MFS family permease
MRCFLFNKEITISLSVMEYKNRIKSLRAIRILKIESALTSFTLFMPVMWLIFSNIGLTQFQIGLTQAIFAATMLILEVPTGYFADRVSKKVSNAGGDFFMTIGMAGYFFANSFWAVVACEVMLGIGLSLSGGADSALLSAHSKIAKLDYKALAARFGTIGFASSGIGAILGGVLGAWNLRSVFLVQAVLFLVAGIFAITIENAGKNRVSEHNPFRDVWLITKYCLHGHKELAWRIFLSSCLMLSTMFVVWFLTPMFLEAKIDVKYHGILFAAISVVAVGGSELVKRGVKFSILIPFLLCAFAYAILSVSISFATILFFLLTSFSRGLNSARISPAIQESADEDIQATAISVYRMVYKLMVVTLLPLVNSFGGIRLQYGLLASSIICLSFFIFFKLNEDKLGQPL